MLFFCPQAESDTSARLSGGDTMDPVANFSRSVSGKVVLVTGAASGMGRATAHVFAREGAKVAATDVRADDVRGGRGRDPRRGRRAPSLGAGRRRPGGDRARDPRDRRAVRRAGRVVNNAGVGGFSPIDARELRGRSGRARSRSCSTPTRASSAPPCPICASRRARASSTSPRPRRWARRRGTRSTPRPRRGSPASPARSPSSSARKGSRSTASARARSTPA